MSSPAARQRFLRAVPWLLILALAVLWEVLVRALDVPEFVLPAPSAVLASLWKWHTPIMQNAAQTLMTSVIGFAIAVVFGVVTGAAIGAGSIVTKDVAPYTIVAGNPARVIRRRVDEATEQKLMAIAWWDWTPAQLAAALPDFRRLHAAEFARKYEGGAP